MHHRALPFCVSWRLWGIWNCRWMVHRRTRRFKSWWKTRNRHLPLGGYHYWACPRWKPVGDRRKTIQDFSEHYCLREFNQLPCFWQGSHKWRLWNDYFPNFVRHQNVTARITNLWNDSDSQPYSIWRRYTQTLTPIRSNSWLRILWAWKANFGRSRSRF